MVFRLCGKVGRIREAVFKLMGTITESFGVHADRLISGQDQIIPAFSAHFTAVLQHCQNFGAKINSLSDPSVCVRVCFYCYYVITLKTCIKPTGISAHTSVPLDVWEFVKSQNNASVNMFKTEGETMGT